MRRVPKAVQTIIQISQRITTHSRASVSASRTCYTPPYPAHLLPWRSFGELHRLTEVLHCGPVVTTKQCPHSLYKVSQCKWGEQTYRDSGTVNNCRSYDATTVFIKSCNSPAHLTVQSVQSSRPTQLYACTKSANVRFTFHKKKKD